MSVGPMEIIIVLALALLIFGPKRLPEMGRTLGRAAREFRKATDEVKGVLNLDLGVDDDSEATGIAGPAAATAAGPPYTPRHEPWSPEDMAAQDPSAPATGRLGAEAVPGLAGFLGVAPAGVEPPAFATGDGESVAPAFASFLGASAAKTDAEAEAPAVAQPEVPKVAEAPEAPATEEAG